MAQLSVVGLAVSAFAIGLAVAVAMRDLLEPLVDLFRADDPSQAAVDAAVEDIEARQGEYWWVNIIGFVPVAFLAGMAVWANRVANVARKLGYPARHSPGWAAAGWFVPVVNLWFPYQSIVDSLAPGHPRRGSVLTWWLLYALGSLALLVVVVVVIVSDVEPAALAVPLAVVAAIESWAGLRVVALVHDDHERAVRT